MCIYIYIYIYTYIYIYIYISLSIKYMYIYIYIYPATRMLRLYTIVALVLPSGDARELRYVIIYHIMAL